MHLVMVHGIWDTGAVYRRMAAYLAAKGHRCEHPNLIPADGRHGLIDLAEKLKAHVDATFGKKEAFALVGFSMGTLICRYYLQKLGGAARVTHFFAISGPQFGTMTAHLWPGKAARDMRLNSRLLKQLNTDTSTLKNIIIHSYRTPFDLMIVPSRSSHWELGENHCIPALFHHRMLVHPKVLKHIAETLDQVVPA